MHAFYFKHFVCDEYTLQYKKQLWGQWKDVSGVIGYAPMGGCHS